MLLMDYIILISYINSERFMLLLLLTLLMDNTIIFIAINTKGYYCSY